MLGANGSKRCSDDCPTCSRLEEAAVLLVVRDGLDRVDDERLANAAGISPGELGRHDAGSFRAALSRAYVDGAGRLQAAFIDRVRGAETWRDGLSDAIAGVASDAEEDPDLMHLCCVGIFQGDRELQGLYHAVRERSIVMLGREWLRRHESAPPMLQLELLCGAITQAVAACAASGDMTALGARLEGARFLAMAGAPAAAFV
jgi:hypothetical protein